MNLIICDPKCKKTYKVAKEVSENLQIPMCELQDVEKISEIENLIIFGGGPHSGKEISSRLEGGIKRLRTGACSNALIVTLDSSINHVSVVDMFNVDSTQARLRKILEEKNIQILGEHRCVCSYFVFNLFHPDTKDITKTMEWIKEMIRG